MFRALPVFSVLALIGAGIPAAQASIGSVDQAQAKMRFESMDRDRDGVISADEWHGSARSFKVHDWNGDGRLSGDEIRIGGQRNTPEQADHAPNRLERNVNWTVTSFNNLDHNRDRRITRNEWHFDSETFRRVDLNRDGALTQQEFVEGDADDDRDDAFDDLDANNDGRVERSEWHAGAVAFNKLDQNRDGVLSRFEVVGSQDTVGDTFDQFADVDYDRSGTITRNEWHGSLGNFDRRDLNHDGILSRQEFNATEGATLPRTEGVSQTVHVDPQRRWTDSGIDVRAGETLAFSSSGTITMSNADDVATPAGARSGRRAPDAPILNQLAGALLARIGDYGPVFVGDRRSIVAPVSGRLYLGVNDDHLPDNTGEFVVSVSSQGTTSR